MGKDQDLLHAVRSHDLDSLQRMLNKHKATSKTKLMGSTKRPINVNFQDSDGMTALHQGALMSEINVMRMLIENGALVDIKDTKGMRPLHYAAWQGREIQAVSLLLEAGSSANDPAQDGMTPLHLACEHGHLEVVSLLLKYHGDPTADNNNHKTPLDLACEFGRAKVVELLIKSHQCNQLLLGNPQEDMADNNRSTCLHLAAKNGHSNVIKLLLQAGVDINRQTLRGTCLHEAALCGKIEVVRLLLDSGVDVNKTNSYDQTALDIVNKFTGTRAAKELKQLLKEASYVVQARVVKEYIPTMHDPNHITLKQGDILTVLEQHPSGMWKGYVSRADGQVTKTGYFPASAVVLVDSQAIRGQHMSAYATLGRSQPPGTPQIPDLISKPAPAPGGGDSGHYGTVGTDVSFPPPPSPLVTPKHFSSTDSDRDSGISPQQSYPSQSFSQSSFPGRQPSPNSPAERTAEWLGRYVGEGETRSGSPNRDSPGSSNRNSTASNNSGNYVPHNYVTPPGVQTQQHRLSGQSYESGVSGVSAASRQSYHSTSSSSLGSLDRLEESGYSSTVNVHELFQSGLADEEILRTWLTDLHFEEYQDLFVQTGYDMPTISHMTPQDLAAIGVSNPKHRKRLKAEINKLHIIDGFPEQKPDDIGEWLHALDLSQYYDCLSQECQTMDGILDIECEDLEEIGITKLGHQKKIQLAIERLKRVQSGGKRLSSLERKGSAEVLDPPTYQTPKWLGVEGKSSSFWSDNSMRKSASGDNLYAAAATNGPRELTTFQQPKDEETHLRIIAADTQQGAPAMGQSWPSPNPKVTGNQQDIVAIKVHRAASLHNRTGSDGRIEGEPPPPYSFYDRRDQDAVVDGDATPTNERRRIPAPEDTEGMATIRRPSAKISPRIAPKPKPVAKIIAKTKRISREGINDMLKNDFESGTIEASSGSIAYSCSTLPRKFSTRGHGEHIYDLPAENQDSKSGGMFDFGQNSSPNSPISSPWGKGGRKAPPPPPKRTNSIKCNMNRIGQGPEIKVEDTNENLPSSTVPSSSTCQTNGCQQSQNPPKYTNLAERFHSRQQADSVKHVPQSHDSLDDTDGFPPPPPEISSHVSSLASSAAASTSSSSTPNHVVASSPSSATYGNRGNNYQGSQYNYVSSQSDNPLNDVIEQLEKTASSSSGSHDHKAPSSATPPVPAPKPCLKDRTLRKGLKLGDWQDGDQADSGEDSDTAAETRRKQPPAAAPAAGPETAPPSTGTDTNTLPFANENVGTIKQRNPTSKPSIVSVSEGDNDDDDEDAVTRNVDLNSSIFDDGTATIKRNPKSSDTHAEPKKVPPPVAPKKKDLMASANVSSKNQAAESGDVLNDIDNMLQDLTNELDAMLELEMT